MRKLQALREHLINSVPGLKRDPARLLTYVEDGALQFKRGPHLSHQLKYPAKLVVTDFSGDIEQLTIPLLQWISRYQPDIHFDTGISFEAEILNNNKADLLITVQLSERVVAKLDCSNARIEVEHPLPAYEIDPCMPEYWQLWLRQLEGNEDFKLIAEWGKFPLRFLDAPVITGIPAVGQVIRCQPGRHNEPVATYTYQWRRNGQDIPGATEHEYVPTYEDFNSPPLTCMVSVVGEDGDTAEAETDPVTPLFSILPVFAGGENGGFYRAADWSTLYQDYLGKDPVTALGQPVGLQLDTSRGGWGDDLAINGNFSGGLASWNATAGWHPDPAGARSPAGESGSISQSHQTPASHVRVRWTQAINSGSRIRIRIRNLLNSADILFTYVNGSGTFQFILPCSAGGVTVVFLGEAADDATVSNVSVTEIDGNHQSTITATERLVLARQPAGGRRNIVSRSEVLEGALADLTIGSVTVASNTTVGPDGIFSAGTVDFAEPGALRSDMLSSESNGDPWTHSVHIKLGSHPGADIVFDASGARIFARFNLQTMEATSITTAQVVGSNAQIIDLGDGWYRLSATCETNNGSVAGEFRLESFTDSGSLRIGGWQVERGRELTPYQCVTERWDVTEEGVRDCYYLLGDGVDDVLTGASLPLSDDYTMVAGLQGAASGTSVNSMFGIVTGNDYLTIASRRDPPARQLLARMRSISNNSPLIQASAGNGAFPHDTPLVAVLRKADGALEIQSSTGGIGVGTYEPSEFVSVAAIRTSSGGGSPTGHFSGLIINRDLTPAELLAVRTAIAYDAGATLEQIDE